MEPSLDEGTIVDQVMEAIFKRDRREAAEIEAAEKQAAEEKSAEVAAESPA